MPIHRHPINRDRRRPITSEWSAKFRRICELSTAHEDCDEDCAVCEERRALLSELRPRFNIGPWHDIEVDYQMPAGLRSKDAAAWWANALDEALRECGADGWEGS